MNYKLNDEKMFMDISDGIAVIINSETGIYYGMNKFGTMIFDALTKGMNTDEILGLLKNWNNIPNDIDKRFSEFTEKLISYELIVPGKTGESILLDSSIAAEDEFVLEVSAYDDAQEMLLADPIHEINEDLGWTPEKESIRYSKEETKEREKKVK